MAVTAKLSREAVALRARFDGMRWRVAEAIMLRGYPQK
jgi:hypothetical protein